MGSWSVDVIGSDTALDMLGLFEEILGEGSDDSGLYPLRLEEGDVQRLRPKLENEKLQKKMISGMKRIKDREDRDIAATVLGALYLVTGSTMPETILNPAVEAAESLAANAKKHGWCDPADREAYMTGLAKQLRAHMPGTVTNIGHVGLFQKLEESLAAMQSGLLNSQH